MCLFIFFLIMPFIYTAINISLICNQRSKRYCSRHDYSKTTLILGALGYIILFIIIIGVDQPEASADTDSIFLQLFSPEYCILLFFILLGAIISLLLFDQPRIIAPFSAVLCVSGSFAGLIVLIVTTARLFVTLLPENDITCNISLFYLWLYVINYFLCQARIIREGIRDYLYYFRNNDISLRSDFSCDIAGILNNVSGWFSLSMFCLVPLTGILILLSVVI